eukprot:6488322-Amphidinium_carterae.1
MTRKCFAVSNLKVSPRQVIAAAQPRRGRLLLMPHACPHAAAPVTDTSKVLLRGEVLPPEKSGDAQQRPRSKSTVETKIITS